MTVTSPLNNAPVPTKGKGGHAPARVRTLSQGGEMGSPNNATKMDDFNQKMPTGGTSGRKTYPKVS